VKVRGNRLIYGPVSQQQFLLFVARALDLCGEGKIQSTLTQMITKRCGVGYCCLLVLLTTAAAMNFKITSGGQVRWISLSRTVARVNASISRVVKSFHFLVGSLAFPGAFEIDAIRPGPWVTGKTRLIPTSAPSSAAFGEVSRGTSRSHPANRLLSEAGFSEVCSSASLSPTDDSFRDRCLILESRLKEFSIS
jgi:hypothetical protein